MRPETVLGEQDSRNVGLAPKASFRDDDFTGFGSGRPAIDHRVRKDCSCNTIASEQLGPIEGHVELRM